MTDAIRSDMFPSAQGYFAARRHAEAFRHFSQRVTERLPPGTPPALLWDELVWGIGQDALHVRFVCAAEKDGRQVWRFGLQDGTTHYAVWDTRTKIPVTILEPGTLVRRKNGRKVKRLAGADHD